MKATSKLSSNESTPSNLAQSEGPSPTCRPTACQLISGCLDPHQCGVVDSGCHDLNRHGACTCSVDSTLKQGSQKQHPPLMTYGGYDTYTSQMYLGECKPAGWRLQADAQPINTHAVLLLSLSQLSQQSDYHNIKPATSLPLLRDS
jgi:hypothetical protein